MTRLLVFALARLTTPLPASTSSDLALASTIQLTHPMRDVQCCAFISAPRLLCSTNDPSTDLYAAPRQLVLVTLSHGLDGHALLGTPQLVAASPSASNTNVAGEVEGIDVHGKRVLVSVVGPDRSIAVLYEHRTPNTEYRTLNTEYRTLNTERRLSGAVNRYAQGGA
jgi:hypothetical protein